MAQPTFSQTHYDSLILGGGVAGLSASIYTIRSGMSTLVIEGELVSNTELPGGALMLTEAIENFPGYTGTGEGLIENLREQADKFGVERAEAMALSIDVDIDEEGYVSVDVSEYGDEPLKVYAKTVIIATGAVSRKLGVPGEEEFFGRGVSTCATCDGWAYEGKTVGVVGGGDTAVEDAFYLAKNTKHVHLFVRGDRLRTNSPESRLLLEQDNVTVHWDTRVDSVNASDEGNKLGDITLDVNGEKKKSQVDGLFVAVGRDPNTAFLKESKVRLDDHGYVLTDEEHRVTTGGGILPNVFAVGDVADAKYVQAITAAGDAVKAAIASYEYNLHEATERAQAANLERAEAILSATFAVEKLDK
jgi:thioredoxin reductase (NADPH)